MDVYSEKPYKSSSSRNKYGDCSLTVERVVVVSDFAKLPVALDLERDQEQFTDFALCGITSKIRKTRVRLPPFTLMVFLLEKEKLQCKRKLRLGKRDEMTLYFITGSENKFAEAKSVIGSIEQIDFDLPEIQELEARKIIEGKLNEAIKKNPDKMFFCEDTSLYIDSLNGLPGPLIKWFLERLENNGIFDLVSKYENKDATARTVVGFTDGKEIVFFEGEVKGKIVNPRGDINFGWDPIFQPEGYDETFAELSFEEKNKISMRKQALIKLKKYLEDRK